METLKRKPSKKSPPANRPLKIKSLDRQREKSTAAKRPPENKSLVVEIHGDVFHLAGDGRRELTNAKRRFVRTLRRMGGLSAEGARKYAKLSKDGYNRKRSQAKHRKGGGGARKR